MTRGKDAAAATAGASAALVTDFVTAAIPTTARTADPAAAYFRKSLRASSSPSSSLTRMDSQLLIFQPSVNRIKGLSKKREYLRRKRLPFDV